MLPVIHVGPLAVTFFSLIVALAVIVSAAVTARVARQRGEDPHVVFDLLGWMLLLGVIVARLFYILNPPPSVAALYSREWYLTHPFDLQIGPLAVWSGGLSMAGILAGATLGALVVLKRRGLDLWLWADIIVPGLLLVLIMGPWGNLLMGQMFGPPTDLPWGVVISYPPPPYNDALTYPLGTRFHPTPAYLSLWTLLVGAAVWGLSRRYASRMRQGDVFLFAAALCAVGLFLADFLRVDIGQVLVGLSGMQIGVLTVFVWAAATMGWRCRRWEGCPKHA